MKKIALSLDALHVESFPTTENASAHRGTVRAAGVSEDTDCQSQALTYCGSCGPTDCVEPTCGAPCEPTFPYSCWGTCIDVTCDVGCPPQSAPLEC